MSDEIKDLNIKELLSKDNYVIPIYQRNYAWGNAEITQLIQDIVDYYKAYKDKRYYIGTLIVYERQKNGEHIYETIDGQQRLTTLTILLSAIKNEYPEIDISWYKKINLKFDSRKISTKTLEALFNNNLESLNNKSVNIAQGYEDAKKALKKILEEFDVSIKDFCEYLFEKVYILRVLVPEDTDLNHYFEIMNSRGEQLEKHEILKAKMIEILDDEDRYAFSKIWEACSNMEKYVQYGFSNEQRTDIFGPSLNELENINKVYNCLKPNDSTSAQEISISIEDLLSKDAKQFSEIDSTDEDNYERFNSVINFPNFLLHILRIQVNQDTNLSDEDKDIPLDDKRLISIFEPFLKKNNKEFVKLFGYNLLKGKFLFDKYIIKREFKSGKDEWSLKQLKWYEENKNVSYVNTFGAEDNNEDENRDILMLLSMFHVSNPTLGYKHWLNAALKFVFEHDDITAKKYKDYLENLADAFLFDRYLAKEPKDYFEIIYKNNGKSKNSDIDENKLHQGTLVENFIFNYLDYLLWQNYKTEPKEYFKVENRVINDSRINNFEFTFRSSVEHYYPQHPIEGNPTIDEKWLNHFGNLCLISISKNSRLSNYMPNAKKEHYNNSPTIDSIKQRIMMEYENWNTSEIKKHGEKMKELLIKNKINSI